MSAPIQPAPAGSLLARVIGLLIAVVLTAASAGLGVYQNLPAQQVIIYSAATLALSAWIWRFYVIQFAGDSAGEGGASELRRAWRRYRSGIIGFLVLLAVFIALSLTIDGFFNVWTVISALILLLIIILTMSVGRFMAENRSAFIGLMVLAGLFSVGSMNIDGFASATNVKSMLLFASFLGLASIGQTLVALVGGLDLSIPYVIGAANVGLLYLIGLSVPPWLAVVLIVLAGGVIGVINGILSLRLQGQALIVTLGAGFVVSGGTQIITSIGSAYSGNVFGTVPDWLTNLSSMSGSTFGLPFPPVVAIWAALALILVIGLRHTVHGRFLYALGINRTSADRLFISERGYWISIFGLSGMFSAITGCLLLGWSGGGFIGVGSQYLFMTLAAVVVGGTSLLGGVGGYGFTVIGVLVLQVLTSFLVGIGLKFEWQQFIFGILILPMVALYARSPHIRTQI